MNLDTEKLTGLLQKRYNIPLKELNHIYELSEAQTAKGGQAEVLVMPKIADIKEKIALKNGYKLKIGTHWEYAMQVTDRTKKQIEMYEEVIAEILSNFSA